MSLQSELERFLINSGFSVSSLSREETWAVAADWLVVFGGAWAAKCRMRTGYRAWNEYSQQTAEDFRIVPLSRQPGGPPEVCRRNPSPPDFTWTLVHTHEDHALGGPYFIRREWAVQANGTPGR